MWAPCTAQHSDMADGKRESTLAAFLQRAAEQRDRQKRPASPARQQPEPSKGASCAPCCSHAIVPACIALPCSQGAATA